MAIQYQFGVSGSLGPIVRACLPDLTTVVEAPSTVLTGTAHDADELRALLELLDAHGCPAMEVRLRQHDGNDEDDPAAPR
jgi:hypothetical protein